MLPFQASDSLDDSGVMKAISIVRLIILHELLIIHLKNLLLIQILKHVLAVIGLLMHWRSVDSSLLVVQL